MTPSDPIVSQNDSQLVTQQSAGRDPVEYTTSDGDVVRPDGSFEDRTHLPNDIEMRKRTRDRVDACPGHDRTGLTDEPSGFPTCSKCGAILTESGRDPVDDWERFDTDPRFPERRDPDHDCLMPSACGVTGFYCSNARSGRDPVDVSPATEAAEECLGCHHPWTWHGRAGVSAGCYAKKCACRIARPADEVTTP